MNSQPLVSVIISCYNHSKYVEQTLNSILEDTYPNKEICIIDDGSKDDSVQVINSWIAKNGHLVPITFKYRENKGVCASLNELIDIAKGVYLVLCASDDMLYGNTIAERVKILEENPLKKVLVSDALVIDENNNVILSSSMEQYNSGDKSLYNTDEGIIKGTLLNPCISGATVITKKDIYDIIGKYPANLKAEDWWFYQRAAALKLIVFKDIKVSYYRVHSTNTSGQNSAQSINLLRTIIKTYRYNFNYFNTGDKLLIVIQILKYYYIIIKYSIKETQIGKFFIKSFKRQ